ncbi:MAG: hypothetical protein ACP5P3_01340 [Ignavibacteria bacterium]
MNNKIQIKRQIIEYFKGYIDNRIKFHNELMDKEQTVTNMYKEAMESKHDTFKEEAQLRRDSHAAKVEYYLRLLSELLLINPDTVCNEVTFGAIVILNNELNLFIFASVLEEDIMIVEKYYIPINLNFPLRQTVVGKKAGETFHFHGNEIKIEDIF